MLPHVRGRPVTMERYPAGIDKKGFIQKDVAKGFPSWLERVAVPRREGKEEGVVHYPARQRGARARVAREPELHHAARLGLARAHAPCARCLLLRSRSRRRRSHDLAGGRRSRCATCSTSRRALVRGETSGSKGFHIVVSVDAEADFELLVRRFSHGAGAVLLSSATPRCSRKSSSRPTGPAASSSTRAATPRARPSRPSTRRPAQAGRAHLGPVHLAGDRARRGRPAHLHPARDGGPGRRGRRPLAGARGRPAAPARRDRGP